MSLTANTRLLEERKQFRKSRPFGFVAKPATRPDGSVDLQRWECRIPGPPGTAWEGGAYPLTLAFPNTYPAEPPVCSFPPGFFHPNVYPTGKVCLSLLDGDADLGGQWAPSISITQILKSVQALLPEPNNKSPAQTAAYNALKSDPAEYQRLVRKQAARYPDPEDE